MKVASKIHGRVEELLAVLEPASEVLILPHDNPDPDALASAAGLRRLIGEKMGKWPTIAIGGIIGRAENRAMVSELEIKLTPLAELRSLFEGAVILVDTQPGRRNNSLPSGVKATGVIDHHPDWGDNGGVPFVDLREGYGATSTIITEYLQHAEVPLRPRLATALFYGISSETRHLGRETEPADIVASQFLYPFVDKRTLGAIEAPPLSAAYFQLISDATYSAVRCDDVVVAILSDVPYPDAVAESADLLVRAEGTAWAVCIAPFEGFLQISLRASDPGATAGLLLASILPSRSAGGHGMAAAGRIPLADEDWAIASCDLAEKVLRALDRLGRENSWLVPRPAAVAPDTRAASLLLDRLPLGPRG
jgi:nanoRNase/pAp phosphatase (c-di-AMP/oligoRNAs hydrolase)